MLSTNSHRDFVVRDSPVHTLIEKFVGHFVVGISLPRQNNLVEDEYMTIYVMSFEMKLRNQEAAMLLFPKEMYCLHLVLV